MGIADCLTEFDPDHDDLMWIDLDMDQPLGVGMTLAWQASIDISTSTTIVVDVSKKSDESKDSKLGDGPIASYWESHF